MVGLIKFGIWGALVAALIYGLFLFAASAGL